MLQQVEDQSPRTWTEDRVSTLRHLWSQGLTARQIADKLSVPRNAVLSKAWRSGLSREAPAARLKIERPPEARRRDADAGAELARFLDTMRRPGDVARKALFDLEAHECRWPIGERGRPGFGFCACRRRAGSSYCEAHAKRARVQP